MDFYRARRQEGDFIILDNSANEGKNYSPTDLHSAAMQVEANEIIVPDALGDTTETISRAKAFVPYASPDYRYMGVLQGTTEQEVLKCLHFYDNAPDMQYITAIGIPRVLNRIDLNFRLELTEFLIANEFHQKFQFHYLGAGPFIREIQTLTTYVEGLECENWDAPGFRGHDTSLPIYLALQSKDLMYSPYDARPEWFFDMAPEDLTPDIERLIRANVQRYLTWARS